jgi:hypothetical protein
LKEEQKENLKEKFPSIEVAYPIALAAYDIALKRFDAAEARIQSVLTTILQITPVMFSIGIALKVPLHSVWFYLAICFTLIAIGIGLYSKVQGNLTILDPNENMRRGTSLPEVEFKNAIIYRSSADLETNKKEILRRHNLIIGMLVFFILEILCLVCWLSQHQS